MFEGETTIHEEHIDRAALLIQHYLAEAVRLWGAGQIDVNLKLAKELLEWFTNKVGPMQIVPLADIYRNGPSALRSASVARQAMRILIQHGWCEAVEHAVAREAFRLVAV